MEEWVIPVGQKSFAREQCATRHELMLIHIQPTAHRDRPEHNEHQRADRDRDSNLFAGHFRFNSGQLVRGPNESALVRSEKRLRRVIALNRKFIPDLLNISRLKSHLSTVT